MKVLNNRINLCYWDNNGGLSLDAKILDEVLTSNGFDIFHNGWLKNGSVLNRLRWKVQRSCLSVLAKIGIKKFTVNIYLEEIRPRNLSIAKKNIMIPNLEWLHKETYALFPRMDLFVCKTASAKTFCDEKNFPAVFTSFTTRSPYEPQFKQKPNSFAHIAGKSETKGTVPLAELWSRHPEWPKLTILISPSHYSDSSSPKTLKHLETENLEIIEEYVDFDVLRQLQNETEIHLCLSEAEGFGHYICEPMSSNAIVVTVDGYPMNELIQPDRGVLVKSSFDEPLRYARRYLFDDDDLEQKIDSLIKMPQSEKDQMKANAKKWFIKNDAFFRQSIVEAVQSCI
ncbi:MAG: hypothetical protein COB23_09585 [Methylophaga sp.]|nr:MAG: hypothetical protein COB23_09585 [Methylophaga sp.]